MLEWVKDRQFFENTAILWFIIKVLAVAVAFAILLGWAFSAETGFDFLICLLAPVMLWLQSNSIAFFFLMFRLEATVEKSFLVSLVLYICITALAVKVTILFDISLMTTLLLVVVGIGLGQLAVMLLLLKESY